MKILLQRLLFYCVAFVVAITINFFLPRLIPGDPVELMFAQVLDAPEETLNAMRRSFGLIDGTLWEQYVIYLGNVLQWDLGLSIKYFPEPVGDILLRALPWTLLLVGTASVLSFTMGTLIGIMAAWYRGGRFDTLISPLSMIISSLPSIVLGLLFMFFFGLTLEWFPTGYAWNPDLNPDGSLGYYASVIYHAILPLTCLIMAQIGGYVITMRNNMINILGDDYITMARGKGLTDTTIRNHYVARNAVLPAVTSFSMSLGAILGGSLITEVIFNYPGLGNTLYLAILNLDYPLIQGQLLMMTLTVLVMNLITDILYVWLDPRLRTN